MAKKSKTQRAKAAAARAERREQVRETGSAEVEAKDIAEADAAEAPKRKFFKKSDKADSSAVAKEASSKKIEKSEKKSEKKAKKPSFLKEVRSEMKRVTWPTRPDVLRWSVVVLAALAFFGLYVTVLDNVFITPLLVAVSGLGA